MIGKMINTSLSCVAPISELAGQAALEKDHAERDEVMRRFRKKVELLTHSDPSRRQIYKSLSYYQMPLRPTGHKRFA